MQDAPFAGSLCPAVVGRGHCGQQTLPTVPSWAGAEQCALLNRAACSLGEKREGGKRQAGLQNTCDLYSVCEIFFHYFFLNRAVYDLVLFILVILDRKCGAVLCDFVSPRGQVGERDRKRKFWLKHEEEIFLPKNIIFSMSTFKCELF